MKIAVQKIESATMQGIGIIKFFAFFISLIPKNSIFALLYFEKEDR